MRCISVSPLPELTDDDIEELRIIAPEAAILTSLENSDTDTASSNSDTEEHADLPEPLTALFNITFRDLSQEEMQIKSEETFLRLKTRLLPHHCEKVEFITRQQSESKQWHTHRVGRITSTRFHRVSTAENISQTYLMDIMQYSETQLNVPSVLWGRSMEETARQAYNALMAESHEGFSVSHCGLVLRPSDPHLGSSPDGITKCTCCGKGVLEIKCPYKYRDGLEGSTEDTQFCLDKSFTLKNSHPYYYQTQLHMFVCGVSHCDFVLWTRKEVIVQRVLKNQEFLEEALPKAQHAFISIVLPELLTRRHDPDLEIQQVCQSCGRPKFGKMITCVECKNSFHYICAKIKRKSAAWLCRECKQ